MVETIACKPNGKFFSNTITAEAVLVERIDYPESGGQLTYFIDHPYPEKRVVFPEAIYCLDAVKRLLLNILRLKLVFFKTETIKSLCWHTLRRIAFAKEYENKYCDSGRELMRVLRKLEVDERIIATICLICEYDNAYRYRAQDLFKELDKDFFYKHPISEIIRLCKLGQSREVDENNKVKWNSFKYIALTLLIPKVRRLAKEFVREIDLDKMKQSIEDCYWSWHWGYYNFGGKSFEKRLQFRNLIHKYGNDQNVS